MTFTRLRRRWQKWGLGGRGSATLTGDRRRTILLPNSPIWDGAPAGRGPRANEER
jgi:hypothetical protein